MKSEDRNRINKLIKKLGSIIGLPSDSLEEVMEKRGGRKLSSILHNKDHPLFGVFSGLKSSFSARLVMPRCSTERFRSSFIPGAMRVF